MKNIRTKHVATASLILATGVTFVAFQNFSSTQGGLSSQAQITQIKASAADTYQQLLAEESAALNSASPAEHEQHLQNSVKLADQLESDRDQLKAAGGALTTSKLATGAYCELVNEGCLSAKTGRHGMLATTNKQTCLNEATNQHNLCGKYGLSYATFYSGGQVAGQAVAGDACIISVKSCQNNPSWVGVFRDSEGMASGSQARCVARAQSYLAQCGGDNDSVLSSYYTDGALVASQSLPDKNPPKPTSVQFCESAADNTTLSMTCPSGMTVRSIDFASYGNPGGKCGSYSAGSCDAGAIVTSKATKSCVGKASCNLSASAGNYGAVALCRGTTKQLVLQATCATK